MNPRPRLVAAAAILALPLALAACSSSSEPSAAGTPAASGAAQTGANLDAEAFAALVSTQGTVLLDVRTPAEFATGHLQGAQNVDLEAADFDSKIAALDRNATYAVYCRSGNRSGQALARMAAAGFTHASHLVGGIGAWTQAGKPVTTS